MSFDISEKGLELYNRDRKLWFVQEVGTTDEVKRNLISVLNIVSKYEHEIDKDFCEMSLHEIETALGNSKAVKLASRRRTIIELQSYLRWCVRTGFAQEAIDLRKLSKFNLAAVRNRYVSSPEHLRMYLCDVLGEPSEDDFYHLLMHAYMWLAFSGLRSEDAICISKRDLDFDNLRITYNGLSYPIYSESVQIFRFLADAESFRYYNQNYKSDMIIRKRVAGDSILRGVRANYNTATLSTAFASRTRKYRDRNPDGARLIYSTTRMSGIFYREHLLEMMTGMVNFDRIADEEIAREGYVAPSHAAYGIKKTRIKKCMKKEYEAWTFAFAF